MRPIEESRVRRERFPQQARLRDGEQYVALGGDLGLSVAFAEVASVPIATLRINHEGASRAVALPMAGTSFEVTVRGNLYRVSVVRLSLDTQELDLRIDAAD